MDKILSGLKGTVAYLDDVLIFGSTYEECLSNVHAVLQRFVEFNVRVQPSKCRWFLSEIEYLGHVIDESGRRPSPKLVSAIANAPTPKNAKELTP